MNFDKIDIIKHNKRSLKIWTRENQKMDKINFDIDEMTCPFGIENFADTTYINWEIDEDLQNILEITDKSFKNELIRRNSDYNSWIWTSAIRTKDKHKTLLRTKYEGESSKLKDYKNYTFDINIVIDSIWLNTKSKTFGILWLTDHIY